MPVRRDPRYGGWFFRTNVKTPDGKKVRLYGTPGVPGPYHDLAPTKIGAQEAEQRAIQSAFAAATGAATPPVAKEVLTFDQWFNGRFWDEWVIGRKNKPSEVEQKRMIYNAYLGPEFGKLRLDAIDVAAISKFRAKLVKRGDLADKTINNILGVLSKPLKYAAECYEIARAPKVGLFKVERPEIVPWEFEEYAEILAAAQADHPRWYLASCLAGEAGLRVGEIKALNWREDVDMIARVVTVNRQTRHKVTTTPKGRTRRAIPMTTRLYEALRAAQAEAITGGYVVRNLDGRPISDWQANDAMHRICERAGLPHHGFHRLRHSFGTHAALLAVNPWRLQRWMGHKRMDETELYVNLAQTHPREIPPHMLAAGELERDPDRKVLAMLSARGSHVAASRGSPEETRLILVA